MSFIEKIQNQPKGKRLLILWISVAVVMAVILLIWFFSFSRSLEKESTARGNLKESGLPSFLENIKKDMSSLKGVFNASVKEVEDIQIQINEGQK